MFSKKDISIYDSNIDFKTSTNRNITLTYGKSSIIKQIKTFPTNLSIILNCILFGVIIFQVIYFGYQYNLLAISEQKNNVEYDLSIPNILHYSPVAKKRIPPLWKHPIVSNINCLAIVNGDELYLKEKSKEFRKLKYLQNTFSTSCEDIKKRGYYPDKPLSQEEGDFPIAYVRTIYTDYLTLEYQFLLTYAPQNHYCFIIDKKQNPDFHSRMFALSNCFENVHIINNMFKMESDGTGINLANYECMKYLSSKNYKYLVTLNNDDMPLKTNREMVEILKIYNGTIDIDYDDRKPYIDNRIDYDLNWSLGYLKIFKEDDPRNFDSKILASEMRFQKGFVEVAYPKKSVDYLVNVLNLTKFLDQLNSMNLYANDEMSFQTIISNKFLEIPGRVDPECFEKDLTFHNNFMTRYTKWYDSKNCDDNEVRHSICLQTIKTLNIIKNLPHFFVNKFKAETDFGGLTCWAEYLYNRTYFQEYIPIDRTFYENLPSVRYQRLKFQGMDEELICDQSKKFSYSN
uniref:Glycosyltransferase family 92 protein n=1 Tax=Strongyloides venezuelensis TaxID=75913 RepID=A0A0K0FUS5_STRVS